MDQLSSTCFAKCKASPIILKAKEGLKEALVAFQISRVQRFGLNLDGLSLLLYMRISAQVLVVFILAILLSSCFEDPDCIELRNNILGISFKKMADGKTDTVSIIEISISNTDSVFYKSIEATAVYLPLNVNQSQQDINFDLLTGAFSMVVDYKAQPQFESVECGPRFVLSGINLSMYNFDSVVVVGSIPLTSNSGVNIVIYSRP